MVIVFTEVPVLVIEYPPEGAVSLPETQVTTTGPVTVKALTAVIAPAKLENGEPLIAVPLIVTVVPASWAFKLPLNSSSTTRALKFLNEVNLLPRADKKVGKVGFITRELWFIC